MRKISVSVFWGTAAWIKGSEERGEVAWRGISLRLLLVSGVGGEGRGTWDMGRCVGEISAKLR